MKTERILAIDPGTKSIGVAVLEGRELIYYGVRTIKRPKKAAEILLEAEQLIKNLISYYQPSALAIEQTFIVQKSASLLNVAAEEMKSAAQEAGLRVFEFAATAVRKRLCQSGKATKRMTAEYVAVCFPELRQYLHRQSEWENIYWANMFDAVAVGVVCYEDSLRHDSANTTL